MSLLPSSLSKYQSVFGERVCCRVVFMLQHWQMFILIDARSTYANPSDVPVASDGSQYAEATGVFVNDIKSLE